MRTTTLLRSVLAAMMVMLCSAVGATDAPKVNTSALSTYDKNAPIGFGASITGSGDENPVTVTTLAELTNALTGTDAKTIYVSGTITFTGSVTIESAQDKTVYGLPGAELVNPTHTATVENTGILTLKNCNNIIIRNITFKGAGAYDIDGNDNLTLSGSTNIWIDHCDFQDGVDGNLDCNNGSDNICVSWCRFRYLISPWSGGSGGSDDHRFSNLWGGGDTATGDEGKLNTTFYACWWDNGCKQRMPRVRFGKVHILNCLYSSSVADYCIGAGYKSNLYVENSVFNVSTDKVWQCYATESGYTDYNIKLVGNSGAADATQSSGSITQFVPTYTYTAIETSAVENAVTAANGAGATLTYGEDATQKQLLDTTPLIVSWNTVPTLSNDNADCSKTGTSTNAATWDDGTTVKIMRGDKGVSYGNKITINSTQYTTIKVSNGAQNKLTMPSGRYAYAVDIYSYVNKAESGDYYWKEVNGISYTEPKLTCLSNGDLTKPDKTSYSLGGVSSFTFNNAGTQLCYVLNISTTPITAQPADATYGQGEAHSALSITASSSAGTLTYQWYSCDDTDRTNPVAIDGANSDTYDGFSTATIGTYYYYCTVSDNNGAFASDVATIDIVSASSLHTVTFSKGDDASVSGFEPDAVQASSVTIPTNRTLFKEGYTLTGWNDGTSTYAIGDTYTPTTDITLTPVFTANTVEISDALKDVTVTWDFQRQNGAPNVQWQNRTNDLLVTQAKVNGVFIDVKLGINTNPGKFNNSSWDDWCQVNEGTIFTLPSASGATVMAYSMNEPKNATDSKSDLDGNDYTSYTSGVATYSTTNESGSSVLVIKGGGYYRYIQLIYPGSGAAWANFESFEMDLRYGAYLTSSETSNTTIGFKKAGDNIVRSDANDDANIGTITGKFHSNDHGLQNFSMMVAVPGYVRVSAGTCAWGGDLSINGTNGFSYTVNTNTGACYHQNTTANKVYAYYTSNEGTTLTIAGGSYMPYIAVESVDSYTLTGTINGGNIDGKDVILTSELTGQSFTATIASGAFTVTVPADTYAITLSNNEGFVISDPTSVAVSVDAPLTINVVSAIPQTVSGDITNAPAEAFTLTFTGASYTETVECAANATSFTKDLMPDTYVISSNVGTLSPLSVESFKVVNAAVTHNIYFPEVIPAATQAEITVDNTATVAANIYNNVSDALAAAKAGNISSPVITLTSGQTYREQVIVDQANVTLKTSGAEKAKITFYYGIGYAYYSLNDKGYYDKDRAMTRNSAINMRDPDRWGCSVKVTNKGNNFRAENIVFENSFNQYYTNEEVLDGVTPNGVQSIRYDRTLTDGKSGYQAADAKAVTERAAAIAFENNPTGVELYNCTFIGSQDTYYTSGTMYVKDCNIVGNTDYIFGGGYVVFDNCDLTIGGYSDKETSAYITAYNGNGRYIFRDCTVKSGGRTYVKANLGRDWGGANASVSYFNLKNEIGNKLEYKWQDMGGAVSAETADLHIYDFDPTVNANYSTTGKTGANINGVLSEADALTLYGDVVTSLGFTPERIYADAVELSESSAYNKCRIAASDVATRNVTLTRSITGGNWSTICLPFGMTAAQVTATFGTDTKLATIRCYNSDTKEVTTASATTIAANTPCFIKVADNVSEGTTIEGVTFVSGEPEIVIDGDFKYVGVYSQTDMASGDFFLANNKLYKATEKTKAIKPFRAYFTGVPANARILFTDGEATRIDATLMGGDTENGDVYDLQGRRVERPVKKGLYINGGRKVIIK